MESGKASKPQGLILLQKLVERVKKTVQTKSDSHFLDKYRCHFEITQPNLLVGGQLKRYQLEALEWMINLAAQDSNGILADDMGLGKTIQAIAYLAYLKEEHGILGKHLVVCPKSVVGNWSRELTKWFPSAKVEVMLLTVKTREDFLKNILKPKKFDIVITTYQGVKTYIPELSRVKWEALIVDQAHKIKNFESQNFQCLNHLKTTFRLLLTGTPLNNNLKELWTLLYFIMPEIFDQEDLFERIEEGIKYFDGSEDERLKYQCQIAKNFHEIIHPFFKRRIKKELELGLPDKTELTLFVPLSKLQLRLYRNFLRFGNVLGDGYPSSYHMMTPRKICQHPCLFDGVEESEGFIEDSGKLGVLDKLVTKLISEKHKILIFSQFVMVLNVLIEYCRLKGYQYSKIDGSDSLEDRDKAVRKFYDDPEDCIFLVSTKAGGLGLNLVAADRVILYDIDWNPQNDLQAMDRAYRIGQTRPVTVYRLVTEKTIEERMLEFQKYKLVWDELVIQKGLVFSRGMEDPFSNFNFNDLSNLGKGDIFHLEPGRQDQNIEQILRLGMQKDKQKEGEIRERLKQQLKEGQRISLFQEEKDDGMDFDTHAQEDEFVQRRNYEHQKRERAKFQRVWFLPAFKFYAHAQQIKDIEFEIHMENKREPPNQRLLEHLFEELQNAQSKGRFHNWSEHEFDLFVEAHGSYRKSNYAAIAAKIGSKTAEEVKVYSQYFFEKAPNNERLVDKLKYIISKQGKLNKSNNTDNNDSSVKVISQEALKSSSDNVSKPNDESSEDESAATEAKQAAKKKKKTKEELEVEKQERERIKQEREKIKQEKEKAKQEEKEAREKKRQEDIKLKIQAKAKREEEAKVREEAKKAKFEERLRINAEREVKKQKDIEERERKKVEEESKKKFQQVEKTKRESDRLKEAMKEKSPSKRTEKSGGRQSGCSLETKHKQTSKDRPPTVTVHDN